MDVQGHTEHERAATQRIAAHPSNANEEQQEHPLNDAAIRSTMSGAQPTRPWSEHSPSARTDESLAGKLGLSAESSAHSHAHPTGSDGEERPADIAHAGGPQKVRASDTFWDDGEDEDLQRFVTARMAARTRDPVYMKMQRMLASRRRLRSAVADVMIITDIAFSLIALLVVSRYQEQLYQFLPSGVATHLLKPGDVPALLVVVVLLGWPLILSRTSLYSGHWTNNLFSPAKAVGAVIIAGFVTCGLLYAFQLVQPRSFILSFAIADALLLALSRILLRPLFVRIVRPQRVLVIGTGRLAVDAARTVVARHRQGLKLVGVAGPERDFEREPEVQDDWHSAMYQSWITWRLGNIGDVPELVHQHEVDLVLIALSPRERHIASWVISAIAHQPVHVYVLPDLVAETAKTAVDVLDGVPVIGLTESAISGWNVGLKRMMDLVICMPMVLLLSPLMIAIAVLVRLDSEGPVLFAQERVGQHNRRFLMYKFRTMYVDADRRAKEVAIQMDQGLIHKRRDDPRITRFGAFLRRTSLDELPQLLNVLKGDMSLVGPRPELPWIVEHYRAWQYRRLLVPQGITGWWQVHGRSDRVLHLHTQDDIYYVRNYSLWLDIKILFMTIKVVLTGKGAF